MNIFDFLFSNKLSGKNYFLFYGHSSLKGGGNIGSTAILKIKMMSEIKILPENVFNKLRYNFT